MVAKMAYVGISRRAAYDIDEIDTYSQQEWGQKVADDYIASIDLALQRLADNPGLLCSKSEFSNAFHLYPVREHYLVCSIIDQNIYVLTVKHGGVDLPKRLKELQPLLVEEAEFLHRKLKESR